MVFAKRQDSHQNFSAYRIMKLNNTYILSVFFALLVFCGIYMLLVVRTSLMKYHITSRDSLSSASTWNLNFKDLAQRLLKLRPLKRKIIKENVTNKPCLISALTSEIKGNRTIDLNPCVMAECQTLRLHIEHSNIESCNMRYCNKKICGHVNCSKTPIASKSIAHTIQDRDIQNCTSVVFTSARNMGIVGGHWKPKNCITTRRVAIIIPFRDREEHLCILLKNLIPILMAQQTEFKIFVIEQIGNTTFNKGRLMNAGFLEAGKMFDFNCVFFHDVDLIPENDRNLYYCGDQPRHLSVAIDEDGYKLMYSWLVGGVLGFRPETFRKVNGYSNMFWGWGGEDDDMYQRIRHSRFRVIRPPDSIARYTMIRHKKRERWPKRVEVLNTWKSRLKTDGLGNVPYKLIYSHIYTYYTKLRIDVGKPDVIKKKANITLTTQNVRIKI